MCPSSGSGKQSIVKKLKKDATPDSSSNPDPHICLDCGAEISRGRDYNRKRHWTQKHADKPKEDYAKYVVPKNNERARKLLKCSKKISESQLQDNTRAGESSTNQASLPNVINVSESEPMQESITNFMVTEQNSETQSPVDKIQGDMNRVVLMLESLTIPEKNKMHQDQLSVNKDITGVLSASNLLEVKHPDITVEILEDGCRVTCYSCQKYQQSSRRKSV